MIRINLLSVGNTVEIGYSFKTPEIFDKKGDTVFIRPQTKIRKILSDQFGYVYVFFGTYSFTV